MLTQPVTSWSVNDKFRNWGDIINCSIDFDKINPISKNKIILLYTFLKSFRIVKFRKVFSDRLKNFDKANNELTTTKEHMKIMKEN